MIEGQFGGIEPQKRVKRELIEGRPIDLHSFDSKSTFPPPPRAANAREPFPHAFWEFSCAISAMVSTFIVTGVIAIVDARALPLSLS